jgi:PAS domain S-box-containing protein
MSKKSSRPEAAIQSPQDIEQENFPVAQVTGKSPFPVVGIGASAGGLSAYSKLLKELPVDTGMAFVLVQHLDPKHASMLPWNRRAAEMFGYSEEEAMQMNASALLAERSQPDMKNLVQQLQQGRVMPQCESWRRRRDGTEFKVMITNSLLYDEAGQPASIAITEREMT